MENITRVLLTFFTLILLIFGIYIFTDWFSKITGFLLGEDQRASLVFCLNEKGAEFYSNTYCAECEKQKEILGESFNSINIVDCGRNKELCPNIKSIPAWYIDKKIYYGLKTIDELQEISGCK